MCSLVAIDFGNAKVNSRRRTFFRPAFFRSPSRYLLFAAIPAAAKDKKKTDPGLEGLPITELSSDEAILHALNRLAYGPRPVMSSASVKMGLAKWIEQQLVPIPPMTSHGSAPTDYPTLHSPLRS